MLLQSQEVLRCAVRMTRDIDRPANRYGFAVLFSAETDNLRIYGQVNIPTVKIYLASMGLFRLCFGKRLGSTSYLEARLAASHISRHIDR